jgi:nitroreductase
MMNETIATIQKRRSIRAYDEKQIEDGLLNLIIESGRYAPSGGNSQSTRFLVIQNKSVLSKLEAVVENELAKIEIDENTYKSLKSFILRARKGGLHFSYSAPTLIVVSNKKDYGNAMADSAVAIENMMIAATSLSIGSCWINQLKWLNNNELICDYMSELGIPKDEMIYGAISLGYSKQSSMNPLQRNGNPVIFVK